MAMTVTATMSGAAANEHIYLWIRVLTGATEAGGASATGIAPSGGATITASLTPNSSNSLPCFAISADNPGSVTAASNNTVDSSTLDADDWQAVAGRYTGTVTGGTPVTFGISLAGGSDYGTWACYEVQPSGGSTPAVDASSPALASATGAGIKTVTSASFTPPAGAVIVAMIVGGGTGSSGAFTMAVSGGSLTWTQRAGSPTVTDQDSFVFTATVPGGGAAPAQTVMPYLGGKTWRRLFRHRQQLLQQLPAVNPNATVTTTALAVSASFPAPTIITGVPCIAGVGGVPGAGWFTDQGGNPKLWVASETWGLFTNGGAWNGTGGGTYQTDFTNYMSQRSAQGVSVVMLDPFGNTAWNGPFNNGDTWDGVPPFVSGIDPTSGLNSAFWSRFDYLLDTAQAYGVTIGFVFDTYQFASGYVYNTWTSTQFTAFGAALGARYKNQQNIVWLCGNDEYPTANDTQFGEILSGLSGAGDTHLVLAWWSAEYTSRYETDNNLAAAFGEANSAANFGYTYNAGYWNVEYAYSETLSPDSQAHLLPVIWGDGYFYQGDATYSSTYDRALRQETWWSLAAGARGILSESEDIWQWVSTSPAAVTGSSWMFVNNLPNIVSYFSSLAEWNQLLPDLTSALVTGGRGTRVSGLASGGGGGQYEPAFTNSWVAASLTPDGKLAVLYLPNATTVTVDTALLATGWAATWVDPVTCATSSAGAGPTFNSAAKGANSQGDPDWALVLQVPAAVNATVTPTALPASAAFPAPTINAGAVVAPASLSAAASFPAVTPAAGETTTTSALAASASFPAPAISAGSVITATSLAASAGFTAPAVSAGAVITTAALACPASFTAPTVAAGETATTTALTVSTAFPAPALRTDEILTTAVLSGTAALPPPAIAAGSTLAATALAVAAAFPAPALQAGQTAAPASLACSTAFPAPTVSAGGSASVTPTTLACSAAFTAPSIRADANLTAASLAGSAGFPAPVVNAGETITTAVLAGSAAFASPSVGAGAGITATALTGSATFTATAEAGSGITTTTLAATAAFAATVIAAGSVVASAALAGSASFPAASFRADANITTTALSGGAAFPVPSISAGGNANVAPAVLAVGAAFPAPVTGASETAAVAALPASASFPAPAISAGSTVAPGSFAGVASFPAPTIGAGSGATVTPATLHAPAAFPAAALNAGATVTTAVLAAATAFPAAAPNAGSVIAPAAFAGSAAFPAPAVTTGSVIVPAVLTGTGAFPAPTITGGAGVGISFAAVASRHLWSAGSARQLWSAPATRQPWSATASRNV